MTYWRIAAVLSAWILSRHLILNLQVLVSYVQCEEQRHFTVRESAPAGHIVGYVNGSASSGIKPNYYVVYPDDNGSANQVSLL